MDEDDFQKEMNPGRRDGGRILKAIRRRPYFSAPSVVYHVLSIPKRECMLNDRGAEDGRHL